MPYKKWVRNSQASSWVAGLLERGSAIVVNDITNQLEVFICNKRQQQPFEVDSSGRAHAGNLSLDYDLLRRYTDKMDALSEFGCDIYPTRSIDQHRLIYVHVVGDLHPLTGTGDHQRCGGGIRDIPVSMDHSYRFSLRDWIPIARIEDMLIALVFIVKETLVIARCKNSLATPNLQPGDHTYSARVADTDAPWPLTVLTNGKHIAPRIDDRIGNAHCL